MSLPSEAEWVVAAQGGNPNAIYPWEGYYLRNAEGIYLANHRKVDESMVTVDNQTNQLAIISEEQSPLGPQYQCSPAKSYLSNSYGMYNMAGNVAEMVVTEDGIISKGGGFNSGGYDLRISSQGQVNGPADYLGFRPVFTVSFTED